MSDSGSVLPGGLPRPRFRRRLPRIHRTALWHRLFHWRQLDIEYALWQMIYLLVSPSRVYRNIYYHKQTKNQWARDDPSFMLLQTLGILVVTAAYSMVYGVGLAGFCRATVGLLGVNYLAAGGLLATLVWAAANRWMARRRSAHASEQRVEWMFAVDVHCNAFFLFFVFVYVVQFCFLPVVMRTSWMSLFLGNTLYAMAAAGYVYATYLGLHALPFLQRQEAVLYVIPAIALAYLWSLSVGFNMSHHVIDYYF
ncbi:hypothetical protein GGI15_002923 [Coemansia interrupta]|uniref:UNC-50 family protein n=1 Tax=Coemansia interrupta TaxID=1126814 RepID=A0A9W8LHY5_9FUNG|nr:hypothetical protein GGI15_002923 [Coemansia interrupta]